MPLYTVIFVVIPARQSDDGTANACKLMDNMKVMLVLDVRRRLCILYVSTFVFLRIIVSPNSLLHFPLSMGRNRCVLSKQHISDNDFAYLCLRFLGGKVEKLIFDRILKEPFLQTWSKALVRSL